MIKRDVEKKLKYLATKFPVVAVLGPRQSGKTTLVQDVFKKHTYLSLEDLDVRGLAESDPRRFLEDYENKHGIILDEIQNVPSLLSYIQTYVDKQKKEGYFVLIGSQNFLINQAITQTLAGRIAILTLLPLSINEMKKEKIIPANIRAALFKGCYPRLYDKKVKPTDLYQYYIRTYIERDVRQIINVTNLTTFKNFLKLCAGRIGQLLNISSLGNDCGISAVTAKAWLSLLEESYIVFLLQPYYKNFSKRIVKSPKIYFYDTGIACSLLGIDSYAQLTTHYLRGGLFESYIISDLMKQFYNQGKMPPLHFWRDKHGHEIDCIIEKADTLIPIEIKAGKTVSQDYFKGLDYWNSLTKSNPKNSYVVYAGKTNHKRANGNIVSWRSVTEII